MVKVQPPLSICEKLGLCRLRANTVHSQSAAASEFMSPVKTESAYKRRSVARAVSRSEESHSEGAIPRVRPDAVTRLLHESVAKAMLWRCGDLSCQAQSASKKMVTVCDEGSVAFRKFHTRSSAGRPAALALAKTCLTAPLQGAWPTARWNDRAVRSGLSSVKDSWHFSCTLPLPCDLAKLSPPLNISLGSTINTKEMGLPKGKSKGGETNTLFVDFRRLLSTTQVTLARVGVRRTQARCGFAIAGVVPTRGLSMPSTAKLFAL